MQTSTYAPEYGRHAGGQVAIATRSGTNALHGALFEYLRNDELDANSWFGNLNGLPRPTLRQTDFGFTAAVRSRRPRSTTVGIGRSSLWLFRVLSGSPVRGREQIPFPSGPRLPDRSSRSRVRSAAPEVRPGPLRADLKSYLIRGKGDKWEWQHPDASLKEPRTPDAPQGRSRDGRRDRSRLTHYKPGRAPLVRGGVTGGSPRVLNPDLDSSYVYNFYFGVQRALAENVVLESAFVGNRGVKWLTSRIGNNVDRFTGLRPNPNFATFDYWDNSDSTRYLSWQTSLRRRYSRNLSANFHYTWAKQIAYGAGDTGWVGSDTQDFFNLEANRGVGFQDVTHVFVSDIVYDLPRLDGLGRLARAVVGGWQVSAILTGQTGLPANITQPSATSGQRPDYIGGDPILSDYSETLQYLNPAAFARVPESDVGAAIRPGTLGRNPIRQPGLINVDFSLGKNFAISEGVRLQIRADSFNAFDHTNLSGLNTNIESSSFGRLNDTRGAREIQLNAKVTF